MYLIGLGFFLWMGCNPSKPAPPVTQPDKPVQQTPKLVPDEKAMYLTEVGRFLGGMERLNPSFLDSMRVTSAWKSHQSKSDTLWARVEKEQLSIIRTWADTEIPERMKNAKEVFYTFSGPDFLYGNIFYPKAEHYVMAGLELPGETPLMSGIPLPELDQNLRGLYTSLDDILNVSFFKTIDMGHDFKVTRFKGIAPVIMLFMARTGHYIAKVEPVICDTLGNLRPGTKPSVDEFPGVQIDFFADGDTVMRKVVYFSQNITDLEFRRVKGFGRYVEKMKDPVAYLKGASYLMHNSYFSEVRNLILNRCIGFLQDDSGMAWKYINKEDWDVQLYGRYMVPIALFANRYQTDLQKEYDTNPKVKPLPFGLGYRYLQNESNLCLAVSKKR